MRRAFDLFCAAVGLIVFSPALAVIALTIKLEDGGPVFYASVRVGRNFRRFRLVKFRSMVQEADRIGGPVTAAGDPRVTRVGSFLRKYKLDELPQLVNVLRGDLQLVGARPENPRDAERFRSYYQVILRERPGITDPATLAYRNEEELFGEGDIDEQYATSILPHKLELSLDYSRRRTLVSDLGIIFRTLLHLPSARAARSASGVARVRTQE